VKYLQEDSNLQDPEEEVEIAVQKMGVFEKDISPQITHTACNDCYAVVMAELDG
jgi:hypothetical protein